MLELHLARKQLDQIGYADAGCKIEWVELAQHLFRRAYLRGWLAKVGSLISGQSNRMLNLASISGWSITGRSNVGVRIVPISQIRGSEGRTGDFDRYFNPFQRHTEGRWLNIALARLNDVSLPPVKLIQLGEYYFVQDGHHRLSVARAFGQTDIDAEVTLWLVSRARTMRSRTASSIYQPI